MLCVLMALLLSIYLYISCQGFFPRKTRAVWAADHGGAGHQLPRMRDKQRLLHK